MVRLPIYLDNQATTRVDPRVLDAMLPYFCGTYGNAASRQHVFGQRAEEAVARAREQVAGLIGAEARSVVFTSGATESNNLALKGAAAAYRQRGDHLISVATEHNAVLDPLRRLERDGFRVTILPVDRYGRVSPEQVAAAITDRTVLVSVMAANNEIGTLQPIREIGRLCKRRGVLFHTDAAQAAGKVPLDVDEMSVDLLSLSAHKMYGPKGVGALYVRRREPHVRLEPMMDGGGHERGLRSGTLPVPLIVGIGAACDLCRQEMVEEAERLRGLRERLRAVEAKDVQGDEIWGFVGMKEKTKTRQKLVADDLGDAYCFVAIERTSKLILAWHLGKRDQADTRTFVCEVERATRGRIQLSTDGFKPYPPAVQLAFAERPVDHGVLVKEYATKEDEHRYSPGEVVGTVKTPCCGSPDPDRICTSHVERHNLTMRMQNRRLTRLTNAFSKKWENHQAALGLYFAVYNFVRPHGTLTQKADGTKTTPAMKAGLTDHPWSLLELLQAASTH